MKQKQFRLTIGKSTVAARLPAKAARKVAPVRPAKVSTTAADESRHYSRVLIDRPSPGPRADDPSLEQLSSTATQTNRRRGWR